MQPTKKYMRGENMRVLLLLRGSAGCGKSTWIEQNGLKQYALSADDIRMMCSSPQMMPDGTHAISQANDNIVWKTLFNILETRMKNGEFTVIDATNSKTSEMNRYKKMCDEYRYRIYCVDMTTVPIEVTKERNRGRQELKRVPEEVIDKMYARFETQKIPSGIKVIQPDELNAVFMKKFNLDQYKRIHHIGDIHGCNTALNTYFEANGGFKDDEFYIFCGDYTDRGIENADVLKFLLSTYDKPNVLLLEGNHERWLWDWAHDKVTASKEFEFHTKAEIEAAGIDKKSIRKLYRRMGQCAYYEFRGKTVLATHAGLSMIPDNLTMVSTSQMIKGVGRYNDAEQVDVTFEDKMDENCYQIHGHRNTKGLPVKVNNHAFNLEGRVEFGGSLRAVILDNDGAFNTVEVKNTVFREPEEVAAGADSVGEWILELRRNKYIKEKQYGDISSFNFTKTAFYDKIWDEQTTKARGLYINIPKQKIVARAYDKFFNINERPETELDKLQDKLAFPVRAYVKENGYLGIVSNNPETGKLFVTTKSNPEGSYAEWFAEALHLCNKVNPDADDFREEVKTEEEFFQNDDVIRAMRFLIGEKEKLSIAINKAKKSIDLDIDAATAVNKYRQKLNGSIAMMMRFKPCNRIETEIGHKFNVAGDPVDYKYDVKVTSEEAYDRDSAKKTMKEIISEADKISSEIDAAKVNTEVEYTPVFDVNDSFEDVMNTFLSMQEVTE